MEAPKAFLFSGDQRDVLRHDDISAALDVEEGQGDTQTGGEMAAIKKYVTRLNLQM